MRENLTCFNGDNRLLIQPDEVDVMTCCLIWLLHSFHSAFETRSVQKGARHKSPAHTVSVHFVCIDSVEGE